MSDAQPPLADPLPSSPEIIVCEKETIEKPSEIDSDATISLSDSELEDGEIISSNKSEGGSLPSGLETEEDASSVVLETSTSRSKSYTPSKKRSIHQSPSWSDISVLMVGDKRVSSLEWASWKGLPSQRIYQKATGDLPSVCALAAAHLTTGYDVVFIMALHHELTFLHESAECSVVRPKEINCRTMRFLRIQETIIYYNDLWRKTYPKTRVIWALPYPIDFFAYNSKFVGNDTPVLSVFEEDHRSREYYQIIQHLGRVLRNELPRNIQLFDMSDVLFIGKENYRDTFCGSSVPKFPLGFLKCGFYASEKMAMYCAVLLIEFMVKQEFFTGYTQGLPSDSHMRLESPPGRESSSRKTYKSLSKRRRRHSRSPSDSSDYSLSNSPKRQCVRSRRTSKSVSTRTASSREHSPTSLPSESPTHSQKTIHNNRLPSRFTRSDSSQKLKQVAADSEFEKTLNELKKLHNEYCEEYRKNPETHPKYTSEKNTFFENLSSNIVQRKYAPNINFHNFWKTRMEDIFDDKWANTQIQVFIEFSRKEGQRNSVNIDSLRHNYQTVEVEPTEQEKETGSKKNDKEECIPQLPDSTVDVDSEVEILNSESEEIKENELDKPSCTQPPVVNVNTNLPHDPIAASEKSDSEDDFDFDELLGDPTFLEGLEDVHQDLKTSLETPTPEKEPTRTPSEIASPTELNSDSSDLCTEYIYLLRMLSRLSMHLGPIGESLKLLHAKVSCKRQGDSATLVNDDAKVILNLVKVRLESLLEQDLTEIQRSIFKELSGRVENFFKKIELFVSKFPKMNIQNIVMATMGKNVIETIEFIKNTLVYLGYSGITSKDVMEIYVSVKKYHIPVQS